MSLPLQTGREARAGFTLVEIMIAVIILAVAVLGMASVLVGTSKWQSRSESTMELTSAAEAKLDQLRDYAAAKSPDTLELLPGGSLTTNEENHADSIATAEGKWVLRRWLVESGPGTEARTVTLRVVPRDPADGHAASSRDFTTIVLMAP